MAEIDRDRRDAFEFGYRDGYEVRGCREHLLIEALRPWYEEGWLGGTKHRDEADGWRSQAHKLGPLGPGTATSEAESEERTTTMTDMTDRERVEFDAWRRVIDATRPLPWLIDAVKEVEEMKCEIAGCETYGTESTLAGDIPVRLCVVHHRMLCRHFDAFRTDWDTTRRAIECVTAAVYAGTVSHEAAPLLSFAAMAAHEAVAIRWREHVATILADPTPAPQPRDAAEEAP